MKKKTQESPTIAKEKGQSTSAHCQRAAESTVHSIYSASLILFRSIEKVEGTKMINKTASLLNQSIDVSIEYLKENAVAIGLLVLLWRFLISSYKSRPSGGYSLSSSQEASTSHKTTTTTNRQEEMRRIRERQQQIADERAKAAAILKKEKERKEKERKNNAALKHHEGQRLSDGQRTTNTTSSSSSRLRSNDYNPMQPWNTGSSGYRYAQVYEDASHSLMQKMSRLTIVFLLLSPSIVVTEKNRATRRTPPGGGS